jgi:LytS/YehU family sensor histidine kinase
VHENPNAADDMIASLSDFLRLTLARGDQPEQSLREELHFIDRYLAIERIRFGERLVVHQDIDPATLDLRLPALILQPLVENAMRHGLEPRPGPGILTLAARRDGPDLVLRIADNGIGMAAGGPRREGIGLSNTRARLRELYGDRATLQPLETAGGGTTWEVRLPASRLVEPSNVPQSP